MADIPLQAAADLSDGDWSIIDRAIIELEDRWRAGRPPQFQDLITSADAKVRTRLLINLIKIDQDLHWSSGQPKPLEQYLQEWPELNQDPAIRAELLTGECMARGLKDLPTVEELKKRFSELLAHIDLDQIEADLWHEEKFPDESPPTPVESPTDDATVALPPRPPISPGTLQPGTTFGRFMIREVLGKGAMGVVYRAYEPQLDRDVALKVPRLDSMANHDGELAKRFLREARAVAKIDHDNICPVFEIGEIEGIHYFTMPLIVGQSLAERMGEADRPFSFRDSAVVVRDLAKALSALHQAEVIHRDVKPGNIMLDSRERPILMDFGLARPINADTLLTQPGGLIGTLAYMSPEQVTGSPIDPRSDLFSLGGVLYQLLTGELPFRGEAHMVARQILEDEPTLPRRLNSHIPRDLEVICLKCLEKDPKRRYASGEALADDLNRFLGGLPIVARPITPVGRAWRWCKRKPLVASLMAIAVISVAAMTATALASFKLEARRAAIEADKNKIEADKNKAEADANQRTAELAKSRERESELRRNDAEVKATLEANQKDFVAKAAKANEEKAKEFEFRQLIEKSERLHETEPIHALELAKEAALKVEAYDVNGWSEEKRRYFRSLSLLISQMSETAGRPFNRHNEPPIRAYFNGRNLITTGRHESLLWMLPERRLWPFVPPSSHLPEIESVGLVQQLTERDRKELLSFLPPDSSAAYRCAFSPREHWKIEFKAAWYQYPLLSHRDGPEQPYSTIVSTELGARVTCAAFNGEEQLAVGYVDGAVRIFDLSEKTPLTEICSLPPISGPTKVVEFSENGRWLAIANDDFITPGRICLWDMRNLVRSPDATASQATTRIAAKPLDQGGGSPTASGMTSPPGVERSVLAKKIELPKSQIAESLRPDLELFGNQSGINVVRFTPDSRWLISGGDDGTVRIWSLCFRDHPQAAIVLRGHDGPVSLLKISPDGRWFVTAAADHSSVVTSDVEPDQVQVTVKKPLNGSDGSSAPANFDVKHDFELEGRHRVQYGVRPDTPVYNDFTVRLWNLDQVTQEPMAGALLASDEWTLAAAATDDHQQLVTLTTRELKWPESDEQLVNLETGLALPTIHRPALIYGDPSQWNVRRFRINGDGSLTPFPAKSLTGFATTQHGPLLEVSQFTVSPDGNRLFMVVRDARSNRRTDEQFAYFVDLRNANSQPGITPLALHPNDAIHFTADGRIVLIADSQRRELQCWDTDTGRLQSRTVLQDGANANSHRGRIAPPAVPGGVAAKSMPSITTMTYAGNGRFLFAGFSDGSIRVWSTDTADLGKTYAEYYGFDESISALSVCTDGTRLVARSNESLRVLNVLQGAVQPMTIRGVEGLPCDGFRLSPAGNWLITRVSNESNKDEHLPCMWRLPSDGTSKTSALLPNAVQASFIGSLPKAGIDQLMFSPDDRWLVHWSPGPLTIFPLESSTPLSDRLIINRQPPMAKLAPVSIRGDCPECDVNNGKLVIKYLDNWFMGGVMNGDSKCLMLIEKDSTWWKLGPACRVSWYSLNLANQLERANRIVDGKAPVPSNF